MVDDFLGRLSALEVPYVFGFKVPRDGSLTVEVGDRQISVWVSYDRVKTSCGCGMEVGRRGVLVC